MRRRRLLALAAGVGTAGCTGGPGESAVTPAPVPTPSGRGSPELSGAVLQPGIVVPGDGFISVVDEAGQYLVVDVAGAAPAKSTVEFRFDGGSYAPATLGRGLYRAGSQGPLYDADGGTLVFALPATGEAAEAELRWPDGGWTPPERLTERLGTPLPPFSAGIGGPAVAAPGDDPQLTVRVSNDGAVAGRYVLALNRLGPSGPYTSEARLTGELPAGGTATHTIDAVVPEGTRRTRYLLDVPGRSARFHVISPAGSDAS